ncbi:MAG: MazG family protein [Thermoleophilia bacterium]|nr:MazG family protein [Thermoleophilia bacterium]
MTPVPVPELERDGGALGAAVAALWELTKVLRAECPWDQVQTAATIVPHTLEEAWEVADEARAVQAAVDIGEDPDLGDFEDELGDLLFQVCFLAMWCEERNPEVDLASVARRNFTKLVRRHPHVFGDGAKLTSSDQVLEQWDQIKRGAEERGLFDGIPKAMPPLGRARKVQSRAGSIGFDFGDARQALAKLEEEVAELREAIDQAEADGTLPTGTEMPPDPRTEAETGDVLFAAVNVARLLRVDPEIVTADSTRTFQDRVELAIELAAAEHVEFASLELDAQETWYQRAKAQLSATD